MSFETYYVGPNKTYSGPDYPNLKWLVVWYELGDWCGSGQAVGFNGDKLLLWELGHCSCYGPFEGCPNNEMSIETFKIQIESAVNDFRYSEVSKKVFELLRI